MEGEDLAGSGLRVPGVGEAGDLACALIDERERFGVGHPFQPGIGVAPGLLLDRGQADPPLVRLGLDHADRLPVDEENVVGRPYVCLVLADGHARAGVEIECVLVLNMPTGRPQAFIDLVPGKLLGGLVGIRGHA